MHKLIQGFAVAIVAVMGFASQPAMAVQPNLLIMSEDADRDTVPRNNQVFRRVITAIQNQMNDQGFAVYDETLITLDGYAQGRQRRSRAEILDIGRSVDNPPIDVVTNFLIYVDIENKGYTNKLNVRVEGELLQVQSGRYLGNFESLSPRSWTINPNCATERSCVLREVGQKARIIANDVGSVLSEKLAFMVAGSTDPVRGGGGSGGGLTTAYTIVLDGFTRDEVIAMEDYFKRFTGYYTHRMIESRNTYTKLRYEGTTTSTRMARNMTKLLETLNLKGAQNMAGNDITITKINLTRDERPSDPGWK